MRQHFAPGMVALARDRHHVSADELEELADDRPARRLLRRRHDAVAGDAPEKARPGMGNWESFHVFCDWDGGKSHVNAEQTGFDRLWDNEAKHCLVVDIPTAVRDDLLRFLPANDGKPKRLLLDPDDPPITEPPPKPVSTQPVPPAPKGPDLEALRGTIWHIIRQAPAEPNGGEWVGEATSGVEPWPHQVRAFQRMYDAWPPKLLIADEVGLGKTIEAGLLLRQAWLSGRAKRILVLAPRAVLTQWQIELREKFNLNWPIYDGHDLRWYDCKALSLSDRVERKVGRDAWPLPRATRRLPRHTRCVSRRTPRWLPRP